MPASARSAQVDLSATPYYHCVSRCVRRAFLCGADPYTGKRFDHRKPWLVERMGVLASVFTIDICAYAVLSNHFHIVLRVDAARAAALSDEAVLRRYGRLFRRAAADVRALPALERAARVRVLRSRLTDISWFMRALNEYVARRANKEDECTGRFWEGRFKSQALLSDTALLTAMSYVDLNPVRAGMCERLEDSQFTSIKQRLGAASGGRSGGRSGGSRGRGSRGRGSRGRARSKKARPVALVPFRAQRGSRSSLAPVPMRLNDYVELLEWTGRAAGAKPGGRIRGAPPAVLEQLRVEPGAWLRSMRPGGLAAFAALGDAASMQGEAQRRGVRWIRGKRFAAELYRVA